MGIRIKETTVKNNTVYCQGNLHHVTVTYCVFRDRATLLICSVLLKHRRICSFSSPRTQLCMKFLLWTTSMAADRLVKQICGTPTKPWNTEKRGEEKKKPKKKAKLSTHKLFIGPTETHECSLHQWANKLYSSAFFSSLRRQGHACRIWKEKIEYHPELEENDSKACNIFATSKSLI